MSALQTAALLWVGGWIGALVAYVVFALVPPARRRFVDLITPPEVTPVIAPPKPRPAQPTAARGQFWMAPTLGLGGQLATERETQERADWELTKQKLAGMQRHPAGKGKL